MSRVRDCSSGGKPGFKWGYGGKCYVYDRNSSIDQESARAKAISDGLKANPGRSKKDVLRYEEDND